MDKKKAITAIILFILTLSSGLFLIKYGIDKTEKIKIEYQENTNKKNISEKEKSKEELLTQKKEKENKLTEEKQNGYTDYYYSLENEINKIEEQVTEIEFEISKIKNGYYDNKASIDAGVKKGIIFILPGVALLIISLVIIITNLKKRK